MGIILLDKLQQLQLSTEDIKKTINSDQTIIRNDNFISLKISDLKNTFSLKNILHLTELEALSLINCNLSELPIEFSYLTKLKFLDISKNKFVTIPEVLSVLPQLETLVLIDNDAGDQPLTGLQRINKIINLDLSQTALNEFENFKSFANLKELDLSETGVKDLLIIGSNEFTKTYHKK